MATKEIKEIKEVTKEEVHKLGVEMYSLQALLETVSLAMYHLQDEPEPVSKAVTMSFVIEDAAKTCEALKEKIDRMEEKVHG